MAITDNKEVFNHEKILNLFKYILLCRFNLLDFLYTNSYSIQSLLCLYVRDVGCLTYMMYACDTYSWIDND